MCIILSYVGVSVVLFLVSRFSPTECRIEGSAVSLMMMHQSDSSPTSDQALTDPGNQVITNDFSLYNSLWFALGAIMQQGVDLCPRFVLIITVHDQEEHERETRGRMFQRINQSMKYTRHEMWIRIVSMIQDISIYNMSCRR